jgi:hypothetical protein
MSISSVKGGFNMAKTVIGLYDNFSEAQEVVRDLVDAGFDRDQISIVAGDREGKYANELDRERTRKDKDTSTSGAATGAVTGGVIGAIAGVVLGLGALAIPGIGPAIAAGPIISGLDGYGGPGRGSRLLCGRRPTGRNDCYREHSGPSGE